MAPATNDGHSAIEAWINGSYINSAARASLTPSCFRRVADILEASPRADEANSREAVVLSACRGVTDALLALVALAERPDGDFMSAINVLKARHEGLAAELVAPAARAEYCTQLDQDCSDIAGMLQAVRLIRSAPQTMRDVISGYGEIWSTRLFAPFCASGAELPAPCSGSMPGKWSSSNGDPWVPRCNGPRANRTSSGWCRRTSRAD